MMFQLKINKQCVTDTGCVRHHDDRKSLLLVLFVNKEEFNWIVSVETSQKHQHIQHHKKPPEIQKCQYVDT